MDKKPEYNPWETDPNLVVDDATVDYIIKNNTSEILAQSCYL